MNKRTLFLKMSEQLRWEMQHKAGATGGMQGLIEAIKATLARSGAGYVAFLTDNDNCIERFCRYRDDYGDGGWQGWLRKLEATLEIYEHAESSRALVHKFVGYDDIRAEVYKGVPTQDSLLGDDK